MISRGDGARFRVGVTEDDTALALGSGDVPVLATPRLLTMFEAATVVAVSEQLESGQTTVGTRVAVDHQVAVAVGDEVDITAELVHVDGRLLRFEVAAHDAAGRLVATGQVTRVVVDRERFLARVQSSSA
jgi:fluoroacetyl-CoA thioesterase